MDNKKNKGFSHLNNDNMPRMVDISDKLPCKRIARAESTIRLNDEIVSLFVNEEINAPKGAVFHTAILAGIQAVKETPRLVPLCHPIPLSACNIRITLDGIKATIHCEVISQYATGVEMEAIVGATFAAITIYDMCKGINSDMIIMETKLIEKIKVSDD